MKTIGRCIGICSTIFVVFWWTKPKTDTEVNWIDQLSNTGDQQQIQDEHTVQTNIPSTPIEQNKPTVEQDKQTVPMPRQIPASVNLDLPFFVQAPDNDRGLPRAETCEEASLALAAYYIRSSYPTKDAFKKDLLDMIAMEKKLFGTYIDTNIIQLEGLYKAYYNDGDTKIIQDPSVDDIKYELAQGHIIVAPFAGRELHNPHFSGKGPRYHMLVIKGYDDTYFYTNDVGTIHGENFAYTYDIIINAMHDLTTGDITQGIKRMLVISKK